MSPVFLEGERGYISKKAGECNLATNDAFGNTLFDRNEAIPTTRNDIEGGRNEVGVRFKGESQPVGLTEKEITGNGSMANIPGQVLPTPSQALPLVDGDNISPDVTLDVINYQRNNVLHGNEDQIAENAENKPMNDKGTPGIHQSGRLRQLSKKAVKSKDMELFYGRKPRAVQHQEDREAQKEKVSSQCKHNHDHE
jgi:hypothetical protein